VLSKTKALNTPLIGSGTNLIGSVSLISPEISLVEFISALSLTAATALVYTPCLVGYLEESTFLSSSFWRLMGKFYAATFGVELGEAALERFNCDGIPSTPVPTSFPDELSNLDDACIENVDITINGQRFTNGVGDYDVDPKESPNDTFSTAHIAIKVDSLCFGDGVSGQAFSFLVGGDLHILWECVPSDGFGGAICGEDFLVTAPSSGVRHFSGDRGTEFDVLIFTQDCFPEGTLALPDCIFP